MFPSFALFLCFLLTAGAVAGASLSIEEALQRILAASPELSITAEELEIARGEKVQSGKYPNPTATYAVEQIFGNKGWRGWHAAESRYEIAQLIETGSKRIYRKQAAACKYWAAECALQAKKIALMNRLYTLFAQVAHAQEFRALQQEKAKAAEKLHEIIQARVEAGKTPRMQQIKSEIAFTTARIDANKAGVELENLKLLLANLWGSAAADFEEVSFSYFHLDPLVPEMEGLRDLHKHPELLQWQLEHSAAIQIVRLEQAEKIPNLSLTLGCKTEQEGGEKGMLFEAALPLPLFDQNQGNIHKARSERDKILYQGKQLALSLQTKFSTAWNQAALAQSTIQQFEASVLKAAQESFEDASEGFQAGKFEYLDLLDSQTTFFDVKQHYLSALLDYHLNKADVDYLYSEDSLE